MTANFDVEFFEGENEDALFATTLNDIELDDLPKLHKALQDFSENWCRNPPKIESIVLDGCDDAVIHLEGGKQIEICGETTFREMLDLLAAI